MSWNPIAWLRARRRQRILSAAAPREVLDTIGAAPLVAQLTRDDRATLIEIARLLIAEKEWEGCGGLELTPTIRATIAGQAALLVLHRPEERDYAGVESILVYPHAFVNPMPQHDGSGVVSAGRALHGEAWRRGPVVLDWDETRRGVAHGGDGHNLVLHEFAHKLDMLDGFADGAPPLASRADHRRWHAVMLAAFEKLRADAARERATLLDTYGATNPAEFFAVATEAFFERGHALREDQPGLYEVLQAYYRQDPASR